MVKIELTIKVSGIHARSYDEAKTAAWLHFRADPGRIRLLEEVGAGTSEMFFDMVRVARELNGTYTVTIP